MHAKQIKTRTGGFLQNILKQRKTMEFLIASGFFLASETECFLDAKNTAEDEMNGIRGNGRLGDSDLERKNG